MPSAFIAPAEPPTTEPPLTAEDAEREVHRLFDAGPGSGLTIHVYGDPGEPARDALREMLDSLRMHDERYRRGGELVVPGPTPEAIARALSVLSRDEPRRRVLEHVLTGFGHRLVTPLGDILDDGPPGAVASRLALMRDLFLAQITELRLTPDSQRALCDDVRALLSDPYLALLAETEEQIERPRVRRLARELLRVLGTIFSRALDGLAADRDRLATAVAARLRGEHPLREVPGRLRRALIDELEAWLWAATGEELTSARLALFARYAGGIEPSPLPRDAYRDIAEQCWQLVTGHC